MLLDEIVEKYKVDQDRIYVTGLSMGGFGTWSLAGYTPERFAAIAPICGGGDPERARWLSPHSRLDLPRRTRHDRAAGTVGKNGGGFEEAWGQRAVHRVPQRWTRFLDRNVCESGALPMAAPAEAEAESARDLETVMAAEFRSIAFGDTDSEVVRTDDDKPRSGTGAQPDHRRIAVDDLAGVRQGQVVGWEVHGRYSAVYPISARRWHIGSSSLLV